MLKETKVGWIGLGVMGSSMAKHIQDAGYSLSVYSRTRKGFVPSQPRGEMGK